MPSIIYTFETAASHAIYLRRAPSYLPIVRESFKSPVYTGNGLVVVFLVFHNVHS